MPMLNTLLVLAPFVAAIVLAPSRDHCPLMVKRNFTSPATVQEMLPHEELPRVTVVSVGYGDHPKDAPSYEQLTFTIATPPAADGKHTLPCVRVEEVGDTALRIVIDGAETAPTFAPSAARARASWSATSTFATIDEQSLVVWLSRRAPYRFHTTTPAQGHTFFVLQVRSYRGDWIVMDPDVVRNAFAGQAAPSRVEYKLPRPASAQTALDVLVRVTGGDGTTELVLTIANVAVRIEDEEFLARQLRTLLTGRKSPAVAVVAGQDERTDPVAAADFKRLIAKAERIRKSAGPGARDRFVFGCLEAFARYPANRKYAGAYREIERAYGLVDAPLDEKYLYQLFANFASAKLAAIGARATRAPTVPKDGRWTTAPPASWPRTEPADGAQPIFDEPVWSWRQQQAAVLYDVTAYAVALHVRMADEPFDSAALQKLYGDKLRLEVAGTYTTVGDTVAGLTAREGNVVGFLPRPWEGVVVIRDGRVSILSSLEVTAEALGGKGSKALQIFTSPGDFAEFLDLVRQKKLSVFQSHMLTLRGHYDVQLDDKVRARRRVLVTTNGGRGIAIIDFSPSRNQTLQQCARWIAMLDSTATAVNLDMGGWDFGRAYAADGRSHSLAVQAGSDSQLSNKVVFLH